MKKRILVGGIVAGLAIFGIFELDTFWIQVVMSGLMTLGALEVVRMARGATAGSPLPVLVPTVAVASVLPLFGVARPEMVLVAAPIAFGGLAVLSRGPLEVRLPALGWFAFSLPYLVLPVWAISGIHRHGGAALLLSILASVWANDSMAYFAGSMFGRHRLAPTLSPKKTWEGSVSGAVFGALVGVGAAVGLAGMPLYPMIGVFVATSIVAQIGDLLESLLKRSAAVKDSGRIMPGHGGVLDRMDAILLAAPLFYALMSVLDLWQPTS